ncbi:MAG: PQQ-dependent sugar dehydrogenase, partial [Chitinophagaceae bacterium]
MHRKFITMFLAVLSLTFFQCFCNKKKNNAGMPDNWPPDSMRVVKQNLDHVWEMEWGPDNYLWFTERYGRISKMDPLNGNIIFTTTITEVVSNGEGGLLGMALHPDFSSNGLLYL